MKSFRFILLLLCCTTLFPHLSLGLSPQKIVETKERYGKKYLRQFRSFDCYDENEVYYIHMILRLRLKNENKDIFNNENLLDNLDFICRRRLSKRPWIIYDIYTYNDIVDIKGWGDNHLGVKGCSYNDIGRELLQFIHLNEFEFYFNIEQIASATFGYKDGVIYVIPKIRYPVEEYKMYPLDEYVRDHWDDLYEGSFNPFYKK